MRCAACGSTAISERLGRTAQGYRRELWCGNCGKQFNERSVGLLNRAQYLERCHRTRGALAAAGISRARGIWQRCSRLVRFIFSYEAVRDWEAKPTPALAENLRRRRKGRVGPSWYVDETYIRVRGRWRYLYRAIDRDGALVDVMLSEHRDLCCRSRIFFELRRAVTGVTPDRVTDGYAHDAHPRVVRTRASANMCGIGRADISTTDLSRTIGASRADVDRCLD